jgi:hypothetical protein
MVHKNKRLINTGFYHYLSSLKQKHKLECRKAAAKALEQNLHRQPHKKTKPCLAYNSYSIRLHRERNLSAKHKTSVLLLKLLVGILFDLRLPFSRLLQSGRDAADEIRGNLLVALVVVMLSENPDCDRQHKLKIAAQPLELGITLQNCTQDADIDFGVHILPQGGNHIVARVRFVAKSEDCVVQASQHENTPLVVGIVG